MDNAEFLSTLSVTDFRAFRRALSILMRAGIERAIAIDILVTARTRPTAIRRLG